MYSLLTSKSMHPRKINELRLNTKYMTYNVKLEMKASFGKVMSKTACLDWLLVLITWLVMRVVANRNLMSVHTNNDLMWGP